MKKLTLETLFIQNKILDIFKEFIAFCQENGINYGLCGGTLLGAVRHNGFIPWDDDLDVYVSRSDAEKIIRMWKSDKYDLISYEDSDYYKQHTPIKIHDGKYCLVEMGDADCGFPELTNYGIFIDIFIYDEYKDNLIERLLQKYYGKVLFAKQLSKVSENAKRKSKSARIAQYLPSAILNYITLSLRGVYTKRQDGTHIGFGFDTHCNNFFIPKEKFLPFKNYNFCGLTVSGPADFDSYLSQRFGDYMTIPSKEDRKGHILEVYEIREDQS